MPIHSSVTGPHIYYTYVYLWVTVWYLYYCSCNEQAEMPFSRDQNRDLYLRTYCTWALRAMDDDRHQFWEFAVFSWDTFFFSFFSQRPWTVKASHLYFFLSFSISSCGKSLLDCCSFFWRESRIQKYRTEPYSAVVSWVDSYWDGNWGWLFELQLSE